MVTDNKLMIDPQTMKSMMDQMAELEYRSEKGYVYDNTRVPRVTEVLSAMMHDDGLMNWANNLGFNGKRYSAVLNDAAEKGTYTHKYIEIYLKSGCDPTFIVDGYISKDKHLSASTLNVVYSCVSAFTKWYVMNQYKHKEFEPVFIEETMICSLFGGTCDLLMKVDGKYWLVDFKTSNRMSFKYSIQLAAYRYLLKTLKGIEISRALVLKLHKENYIYEEYSLELDNPEHEKFMNDCEQLFMMLVCAFKMRAMCAKEYKQVYGLNSHGNKTQERIRYEQEQANRGA